MIAYNILHTNILNLLINLEDLLRSWRTSIGPPGPYYDMKACSLNYFSQYLSLKNSLIKTGVVVILVLLTKIVLIMILFSMLLENLFKERYMNILVRSRSRNVTDE